jgi:hypothetical protein
MATWDSAILPSPPAPAPTFPTAPPNGNWNETIPSLWQGVAGPNAGLSAPSDLTSDAGQGIPTATLNPTASGDDGRLYEAITAALAPLHGAAAGRPWTVPPRYPGDLWRTSDSTAIQSDPRIISDITPDNDWTPRARYASNSRRSERVSGPIRIGERLFEPEPGQALRLFEAETRAEHAIARVRELDPGWRPRPSAYESIEGLIRAHESDVQQAQARLRELARVQFSSETSIDQQLANQRWSDTAREIAQWLVKNRSQVSEGGSWLFELEPSIEAYLDQPRSLEELQQAVSNPKKGYDIHHIVEKNRPKMMVSPRR